MKIPLTDYDTQWKAVIAPLFQYFIEFVKPDLYELIDFSVPPQFLEQEFHEILPDKYKKGKVINDKFVKVKLKKGEDQWIVIHIEIETEPKKEFKERMFVYFYRIFDHGFKNVTVIAFYVGDNKPKNYNKFEYELYGTKLTFQFNAIHIKDLKEEDLLRSDNPFALVLLAGQYILKTKEDSARRFGFKRKLFELADQKKFKRETIFYVLQFIYLAMTLPEKENKEFYNLQKKNLAMNTYEAGTREYIEFVLATSGTTEGKMIEQLKEEREQERKSKEVLIRFLIDEKYSVETIAKQLGMTKAAVIQIKNKIYQ